VDFVKVLDFGLARPVDRGQDDARITLEAGVAGTPAFMAPEQILGDHEVGPRTDLYALGCVAYWLLTGQRVFEGTNAMQMVIDHVRTPPVPPSRRGAQPIPEALEDIVMRCLQKDPGARPASAAALSRELFALDLEARWTEARGREWWQTHTPGADDAAGPTAEVFPSREITRSAAGVLAGRA
jgi:serine/threonine-protein kinase